MLSPTWDHPSRHRYAGLDGLPSIEALFEEVTERCTLADRTVVVDGAVRLSGTDLADRVKRLAGGLAGLGVRRGDTVAFQVPSWWETIALYRACWRLGATAVPVHHLAGETDVERALVDAGASVVFAAAGAPAARRRGVIAIRGDGGFEELLGAEPYERIDAEPADIAVVLFTSGSTGGPKGVMHTHRTLVYKALSLREIHGVGADDIVLMPAPMAHISGLSNAVMLPGAAGMRTIVMERWSPIAAVDLVRQEGVTYMSGPPTFFSTMLAAENFTPDAVTTLRLVSCGGAGVTPAFVAEATAALGAVVKRTYGSTEAPVVTTWHAGDDPDRAADSDGRAAGEIRIRTVDPDAGEDTAGGTPGEIWIRGPELFVGYTDASRNAASITADDWFRTGDIGTLDEAGWLRVVGRMKDIIIRGGENISAAELEAVIEAHPAVRQAVAVGFPDARLGERVCAFVVVDAEASFDLEECRAWFEKSGVTKFKWPERVERIEHLPVLESSGKADRAALRGIAHSFSLPS